MELEKNTFYHGDCLFVLTHDIPAESVDLIYLDPPFFTGQVQKGTKKWQPGAMEISFEDRKEYWAKHLDNMRQKAPIWLGDVGNKRPEFAAYLYYMMERLQACHRVLKKTGSIYLHCDYRAAHYLKHVMDDIFGEENFQNDIIWAYRIQGVGKKRWARKHENILFYSKSSIWKFKPQKERIYYEKPFYDVKKDEEGRYYRDVYIRDTWDDIKALISISSELVGYPTQKPEALLKRIILASSDEGDTILDPFCGCGTTAIVASKLNRKFIGIDIDPTAFEVIKNRSHELFGQSRYVSRELNEVLEMGAGDFEKWVNEFYEATKPSPDAGVDGITKDGIPIQTKTGRVDYSIVNQFLSSAQLHSKVPQPTKQMVVVSQTGFDDSARKTVFEIKAKFGIEIQLKEPKDMLEL